MSGTPGGGGAHAEADACRAAIDAAGAAIIGAGLQNHLTVPVNAKPVTRGGRWTGETRTVVRYNRWEAEHGRDLAEVLRHLPDAQVVHGAGRIAVIRASTRNRCGCRGEINQHVRDRTRGCPVDWDAVRLLPRDQWPAGATWPADRTDGRPR